MIPTRSRKAACSAASSGCHGGLLQPNARWSSPASRQGSPGRSGRRAPSRSSRRTPRRAPPGGRAAGSGAARARPSRCRAGSAGGSSSGRPRARARSENRGRGRPRRSATGGRRRRRSRSRPPVIHSARLRPSPPAPPKPLSDSPAATQNPRTPGIGPSSGLPSGVIASGWQSRRMTPACSRNGKRRIAPSSSGAKRSMSDGHRARAVLPRHAVEPARGRVGLVAADQHAAGLALAVDQVVGVAEARRVARDLVRPATGGHRDVLVVDRHRGDERADHRRHLRRPDPGRVDDVLGLDPPSSVQHRRARAPSGAQLDRAARACAGGSRRRARARRRRPRGSRCAGRRSRRRASRRRRGSGRRRRRAAARAPRRARSARRPARSPRRGSPPGAGRRRLSGLDAMRTLPTRANTPSSRVELDRVAAEAHHRRRRVERGHEARGVVGRAARQLALLEQQHVVPAGPGEVVGDAGAGDTAADHHDARSIHDPAQ